MGKPRWQEFCVICGGPPSADTRSCAAGQSGASRIPTAWLNDWVGVTPEQPDEPIDIGAYGDHGCWHYQYDTVWREPRGPTFAAYGKYVRSIAPNERRHDRLHGPPGSCECVQPEDKADRWGPGGQEDEDGWYERVTCPGHAPAPGLHWLDDWWGGDSNWVRYGVAFHRSCGQVLQQRLGYRLNFNHVWPLLQQQQLPDAAAQPDCRSTNHFWNRSYGGTERYHGGVQVNADGCYGASFMLDCLTAEDEYLLLDPLQCSGNADRIVGVWEPLVKQWERAQRRSRAHPAAAATAGEHEADGQGKSKGSDEGRSQGDAGGAGHSPGGAGMGREGKKGTAGDRGDGIAEGAAGGAAGAAAAAALAEGEAGKGPSSTAPQARRVTPSADAGLKALHVKDTAPGHSMVLQLVVINAGSPKAQLTMAAQLLPLSSTMPQLLAGCMQLAVAANTWPKVQQVARWLGRYGCLLNSLALDAVVDCCPWDAERSNTAVLKAIEEATTQHQGVRLVSLSLHIPLSADPLLQSLPLAHLTALHLPGPWELSAEAAAALAAATALRQLTLPGAGLGDALAADSRVLPAGLQRLRLCDAGGCSAATLRALSGQLSALTHLSLDYNPLGAKGAHMVGVVSSADDSEDDSENNTSRIVPEVQECWTELPALRSLQLGARHAPQLADPDFISMGEGGPLWGNALQEGPRGYPHLLVGGPTLESLAAVTGLTSLMLGPSAQLEGPEAGGSGLRRLLKPLQELTQLQRLTLTLQVSTFEYGDEDYLDEDDPSTGVEGEQLAVMTAVAELPALRHLAVSANVCGRHIGCLEAARELTRVEFVQGDWDSFGEGEAMKRFCEKRPGLVVRQSGTE